MEVYDGRKERPERESKAEPKGENRNMTKRFIKKTVAIVLTAMIGTLMLITGAPVVSAESPTNVGLAAHALRAYREDWTYVWGGSTPGAVDCSGLIYSYYGVGGNRVDMLGSSSVWGYVSNGVPNIHGLGLHSPGHVGLYVGSGMAADARDVGIDMCYQGVYERPWVEWFKIYGVSYPYQGWVLLDGNSFYYEDGEYLVSTSRTLDGVTYNFNSAGVSDIAPPSSAYEMTDYSEASSGYNYNYYNSYYDDDDDDDYDDDDDDYYDYEAEQERIREEERRQAEEAERARKEEEERLKKEEEEREREAQREAMRKLQEEKRLATEAKRKAEAEAEAKRKAEAEARRKAEAEAEAKRKAEEEAKRLQEEEDAKVIAEFEYEDDEESKTVSSIQTRLYELGYLTEKATGYYGDETVTAVMLFQGKNDLEVSGVVTSKTYTLLKSTKAKSNFSSLEQGAFDDGQDVSIASLQTRLTELKYYYDDVSGYYGEPTANAVKQFQKNNELDATGIADPDTQLRIFSSEAKENPNAGNVSYGDSGSMIVKLQKRLIELRYLSGIVTEKFDDATRDAVYAYQKAAGLEESDTLTAEQLEVLYSDDAVASPEYEVLKYGYSGNDVAELQAKLSSLRYYSGKTSGVYSRSVASAVANFQEENGLAVTGYADQETIDYIKTETQRESAQAGEQLIIQTAAISDNAFAGIGTKSAETVVIPETQTDFSSLAVVLGSVLAAIVLFAILFVVELKKKETAAEKKDK